MPSAPEPSTSAGDWAPIDAVREPVEERLADRLSARQAGAGPRMRAVALLRRLGSYDRAAYRSVARLSTPLLDEPLRRVSDFANFSKPWFLIAGLLALLGGRRGRRAALIGLAADRRGVPGGEPAHEVGWRTPPARPGWSRCPPAAMGAHAGVDIVPLRSLRVRRRLRRRRRRRPAGAQAAAAGSRLDRGVFPRIHRRALPQ